jgi:hypothetical protein
MTEARLCWLIDRYLPSGDFGTRLLKQSRRRGFSPRRRPCSNFRTALSASRTSACPECPLYPPNADMCSARAHVRFGSKADICAAKCNVRFAPESGHVRCISLRLLWANSGHLDELTGDEHCRLVAQSGAGSLVIWRTIFDPAISAK